MEPVKIKELIDSVLRLQTITQKTAPHNIQNEVESLAKKLRPIFVEQAVVEVISNHYDFGEVTSVTPLFGGLINQNFAVATNNGQRRYRLFIKRYRKEADVKEIILEHKFNQHLCASDFPEVSKCIQSKEGETFVEHPVKHLDSPDKPSKFAVYSYLEGEDRYGWLTPHCTMKELASASSIFAKIHERGFGFEAGEYAKEEPKIIELMDEFPQYFSKFEKKARGVMQGTKSAKYFLEKLPSYLKSIATCQLLKDKCKGMLEVMIHGDYHPGNQKYSDDGVVGVFDFDWGKEDLRLFDVAITITYFCTSWKEHENGTLFFDEIMVFLEAYQEQLKNSDRIFPLTREELTVLPEMILMANMYVIWWDLREIFEVEESESDVDECLVYLAHNTKINDYALAHLEEMRQITHNIKSF